MSARAITLLVACAPACASDTVAFLSSEGHTHVLLVEIDGAGPRGTLYALDAPGARVVRDPPSGSLYALGYSAPPTGLTAGPITFAATGTPLPPPDHVARLDGEAWTELAAPLPRELSDLRTAASDVCLDFDITRREFPGPASVVVPLDRDRGFAASIDGRFFVVTASGLDELTTLSTTTPHRAGFARGGEVFMVSGRAFTRGTPDGGFTEGPPLAAPLSGSPVMTGSPSGPLELWLTDRSLTVQRFDGTAWSVVRAGVPGGDPEFTHPSLAWIAPGMAALAGVVENGVYELSTTQPEKLVRFELMTFPNVDGVWTLAHLPGVGTFAGTLYSRLFQRTSDGWVPHPLTAATARVDAIVDLGGGRVVAGGQDSVFSQWGPRPDDVCAPFTAIVFGETYGAVPLGDGFAAIAGRGPSAELIVLTPR